MYSKECQDSVTPIVYNSDVGAVGALRSTLPSLHNKLMIQLTGFECCYCLGITNSRVVRYKYRFRSNACA